MHVKASILETFRTSILRTHDSPRFEPLANTFADQSFISFTNDTANNTFALRLVEYLKLLNQRNMILDFFETYKTSLLPAQQQFPEFIALKTEITDLYSKTETGTWGIDSKHFDCCLVRQNFAFLDRKPVRKAVKRIINATDHPILRLTGKPKAGLSHTRLFLRDLELRLESFRFIEIDLKYKISGLANDLIYAAHVAQFIAAYFEIPVTIDLGKPTEFKIMPFLVKLKLYLDSHKQKHVFFIDQFDVPLADDVFSLVTGIAELHDNKKVFLVLARYPRTNEWNFLLENNSKEIDIKNGLVTPDDVKLFFENAYLELMTNFGTLPFSKEAFFTEVNSLVKAEEYAVASDEDTNVVLIGQLLSKWYKNLYERISDT